MPGDMARGVNRGGEESCAINRGRSTSDFKDSSWCVRTHRGFRLALFMLLDPRSSGGPGMSTVLPKCDSTVTINYLWPALALKTVMPKKLGIFELPTNQLTSARIFLFIPRSETLKLKFKIFGNCSKWSRPKDLGENKSRPSVFRRYFIHPTVSIYAKSQFFHRKTVQSSLFHEPASRCARDTGVYIYDRVYSSGIRARLE